MDYLTEITGSPDPVELAWAVPVRRWSSADVVDRTGCTVAELLRWRHRHGLGVAAGQGSRARFSWREMLAVRSLVVLGRWKEAPSPERRAAQANTVAAVMSAVDLQPYLMVRPDRWVWLSDYEIPTVVRRSSGAWQVLPFHLIAAQMAPGAPR